MLAAAIYFHSLAFRGWIHHDEGLLAHSAERVLDGQLPHRDFDEVYSGGLSLLHALAFKLWGTQLSSIRIMLLVFSVVFVATVYAVAARIVSPWVAALVTCLCAVWSVPNYFAGLPSWYNLFLATFGIWTLMRYLDSRRAGWLVAAGAFGGLSLTVKIIGAYYVPAVLLFLVDCERRTSQETPGEQRSRGYWLFVTASLALFVAAIIRLVMPHLDAMAVLIYVAPATVLAIYLSASEWQSGHGPLTARLAALARLLIPFALGVCVPVGVFLVPYLATGAIEDLYRGVFVLPQRRLTAAAMPLPGMVSALAVLPYAGLLIVPMFWRIGRERLVVPILATVLLGWLVLCGYDGSAYRLVWYSARPLVPVLAVTTAVLLARETRAGRLPPTRGSEVLLLAAMAATLSLVQYPYASGIYFCYVAPIVALAIVSVVAAQPSAPRLLHLCVLGFYLLFAVVWLNTNFVRVANVQYMPVEQDRLLSGNRGGIRVQEVERDMYAALVREVQAHSAAGSYIYAAPDCPEVYFLAARKNPTRTLYDMFDDPHERTERLIATMDQHAVTTVVVNRFPEFSAPITGVLADGIKSRFTNARPIGRFVVLWRAEAPQRAEASDGSRSEK